MLHAFLAIVSTNHKEHHPGSKEKCFQAAAWAHSFTKDAGFRTYSQGYQDSVLQSLFDSKHLGTGTKKYVEFGFHVEDIKGTASIKSAAGRHPTKKDLPAYGANTELLQRNGWQGVRFDGDEENKVAVPNMRQAFITPQNVVALFKKHELPLDVDYVSIDVDSCDLWIFLALTDVYRPTVISIEYNPNYGFNESLTNVCTSPADNQFFSSKAFTNNHWGNSASLLAISNAAERRGYAVVWVEPLLDVFLVRKDRLCDWPPLQQFEFATGLKLHEGRIPKGKVTSSWPFSWFGLGHREDGRAIFRKWVAKYY